MKVAIIGSGIGGICSAIRLKNQGFDVNVYEKNNYPGGKLSTFKLGDFRFDAGPSLFTMPHLVDELFTIGLNRAITLISEAKPGRISSSMIKDLGEHPEDKKPVRVMKGQYGPYIKYKSLNATIPEEKDPNELTMDEALILIEKRKEYDKNKKKVKK